MAEDNQSVGLLKEEKVMTQKNIRIPPEVQDIIFSGKEHQTTLGGQTNRVYFWYIHSNNGRRYVYIANETPREENSTFVATTQSHKNTKNRTSLPQSIIDMMDIEKNDTLYFFAHDKVENDPNPSVAVLPFEELRDTLHRGIQQEAETLLTSNAFSSNPKTGIKKETNEQSNGMNAELDEFTESTE